MHGLIFTSLQNFITTIGSTSIWEGICLDAGVVNDRFSQTKTYASEDFLKLIKATAKKFHLPQNQMLEEFGKFLVHDMFLHHRAWISPEWDALDFLSNAQGLIHPIFGRTSAEKVETGYAPYLHFIRKNQDEVVVVYQSPLKLCPLVKGLILGVGKQYGEPLNLEHSHCMLQGERECRYRVTVKAETKSKAHPTMAKR